MDKYQLKARPVVIRRELLDHYSDLGLDEQDLVILLKLIYASETSRNSLQLNYFRRALTMQPRDITMVIQNLIQRELLELQVQKDEEGRFTEYMNLDPFFEKLSHILKQQSMEKRKTK
ncbi:hypothetical protein ACVPOQ_00405 [Staphylococcus aureus]